MLSKIIFDALQHGRSIKKIKLDKQNDSNPPLSSRPGWTLNSPAQIKIIHFFKLNPYILNCIVATSIYARFSNMFLHVLRTFEYFDRK